MATQLALLYILDVGCGELPIDFNRYYRPSWLSIGILGMIQCLFIFDIYLYVNRMYICVYGLGAFSSCNGDTWASELATVLDKGLPIMITTGKQVPKGNSPLDLFTSVI